MISYFIPHKNASNPDHLREVGLEMLLREGDDGPHFADLAGTGPGGKPGQIISWTGDGLAYLPEQQDWIPAIPDPARNLPAERYWIGTNKGQKPTPLDLMRLPKITFDGFPLQLGDGNTWVLPNALRMPHYMGLNERGELDRFPVASCKPLYDRTLWALEHAEAVFREEKELDEKAAFNYVVEMLAVNYRICPQIVSLLQLFNDENLFGAMCKTTDLEQLFQIREELKKNSSV
ncbi:hypothetical protein [Gimesia fumaroli]|uniref:Uncharacterized protein n=1 Tax=Gimesia fumaroli TaxID=2527976 RepID=A0A518ICM1_9PLAN|nr:hypothetical protein [Gimesia fumaroli]QDV50855.1 hypothetical protein Enr17x_29000 [Gimesia fumaroli]